MTLVSSMPCSIKPAPRIACAAHASVEAFQPAWLALWKPCRAARSLWKSMNKPTRRKIALIGGGGLGGGAVSNGAAEPSAQAVVVELFVV